MNWWTKQPSRLVQTNLREIDADLDPDQFVAQLKAFSADVVLFNAGGIVANYETQLPYHYRNPYLRSDLMAEVITRTRAAGIRFMARFDFGKIHESLAVQRPEWLYLSEQRKTVNYNGQVHTCLSGGYQQVYCLQILSEVIARYDLDAVFFNMVGYVREDYDRNYYGVCQCENCRASFNERTGHDLPPTADPSNPAYLALERFCHERTNEQIDAIARHVKQCNPAVAVCTYTSRGVDIYRKESNSGLDRMPHSWNYSASDNVKSVTPAYPDKAVSNSAVHFLSMRFRHSAVAPDLTFLRIAQNIANAAWLDYYVIGPLERQDDRACFDGVKALYRFYADHVAWYSGVTPVAELCLIHSPSNDLYGANIEYQGLVKLLVENHVLYDSWPEETLEGPDAHRILSRYRTVLIGEARRLHPGIVAALDAYVATGGTLMATGLTATHDQAGSLRQTSMLASSGIRAITEVLPPGNSRYLRIRPDDKQQLGDFDDLDIVSLHTDYMLCETDRDCERLLAYIPPHMWGPPEKCYYLTQTDQPGLLLNPHGAGRCVSFPWGIGAMYQRLGNHAHRQLFTQTLTKFCTSRPIVETDAPPQVEIQAQGRADKRWMLVSLVNHAGQNGTAYLPPVPIQGIALSIAIDSVVRTVRALRLGVLLPFAQADGRVRLTLEQLDLFETLVLES